MSQDKKRLLVIGACLALIGYVIRSNAQQIVVQFLNGSNLLAYGIGNQDDAIKIGFVAFVGLAGILGGIIFGIIGFMKGNKPDLTVPDKRYCSNCGTAAAAGAEFCAACGSAVGKPSVEPKG